MTHGDQELLQLFRDLYKADCETNVDAVVHKHAAVFADPRNWRRLGGIDNNFGVVENQQSSPIASLIEKLTNCIDALLMRQCHEEGVDPKSEDAPRSMAEAVGRFFPNHKQWDYPRGTERRLQAEQIQILADGPKKDTSLVIYDDGEGQHPQDFETTFLSLLRGNKNDIHFVQGKYNMGGSGAIAFCGKKRYQLIASRRYDGTGKLGFTLVRKHPFVGDEEHRFKSTWYEYLVIGGAIPAVDVQSLDLGLHKRMFTTGTIIKLYSYQLPTGISDIARDLNQSINEYLFEPALPLYTIEKEERYPLAVRERHLFGLKRRLEQEDSSYVEDYFSEQAEYEGIGTLKVTCYVFKARVDRKSAKETRQTISREFFKNNMSVLFSLNGQVHGYFSSEFISRTLKMNLLKNYLLIHVDCTGLTPEFRNELTMASRDRLKAGGELHWLRQQIADMLSKSKLAEINKRRKEVLDLDSSQADDLVRSFADNLPLNSEMTKLLDQVFKLDRSDPKAEKEGKQHKQKTTKKHIEDKAFEPKRFPSFFRLSAKGNGSIPAISIPKGSQRTIYFSTDVENMYFDRVEEPGDLQIALLDQEDNETTGGNRAGKGNSVSAVLNVRKSSPNDGMIKLHLNPTEAAQAGESFKVQATLTNPGGNFAQAFWVKVRDPQKPPKKKEVQPEQKDLGLPAYKLMAKEPTHTDWLSWEAAEDLGAEAGHEMVMHPVAEGDTLKMILINMDSTVWMDFRAGLGKSPTEDQLTVSQRRYIASVYFHTLFLYMIMKTRGYQVQRQQAEGEPTAVEVDDYLKDVFQSYYADFLMRFNMSSLVEALGD
jgi:hypothetical protein